jgi:hypothetical protein
VVCLPLTCRQGWIQYNSSVTTVRVCYLLADWAELETGDAIVGRVIDDEVIVGPPSVCVYV